MIDFSDPSFIEDPYPTMAALRQSGPVQWDDSHKLWLVSGYAEVVEALKSPHLSVRTAAERIKAELGDRAQEYAPLIDTVASFMTRRDGMDHARLRALVLKAFTPPTVQRMHDFIQQRMDALLDAHARNLDLVAHVAEALPLCVIGNMLGISEGDLERVKSWADALSGIVDMDPDVTRLNRALQAAREMRDYVGERVADHRQHPRDNLLSALIAAEDQGQRLSEAELFGICQVLLIAGHETTTGLIGNGTYLLLTHSEAMSSLRSNAKLLASAVEEMLRYDSPVQVRTRTAIDEFALGGQQIHRGELLYILLGAANRDSSEFPDPTRFDVTRTSNRHVAFGEGAHYCVGSALARLEGRIAIQTILDRFPHLALRKGFVPKRRANFTMRSWMSLPVMP